MTGTIKRLISDKYFGFILGEGNKEYFFHRSDIDSDWTYLIEGLPVTFEAFKTPKGLRAGDVKLVRN